MSMKELQNGPSERKGVVASLKTQVTQLGKKNQFDGQMGGKLESANTTKKLIFSFKKNEKQKVTPPNASAAPGPKPSSIGQHRRV